MPRITTRPLSPLQTQVIEWIREGGDHRFAPRVHPHNLEQALAALEAKGLISADRRLSWEGVQCYLGKHQAWCYGETPI